MLYCFVKEDLDIASPHDPLLIQAQYAKSIGCFCVCSVEHNYISDENGRLLSVSDIPLMLRTSCDHIDKALFLLTTSGAHPLETAEDIFQIERWYSLNIANRPFYTIRFENLLSGIFSEDLRHYLQIHNRIFIKTRKKGISVSLSAHRILDRDPVLVNLLSAAVTSLKDELLITEELNLKRDILGTKETRHFVFGNKIYSSSRFVHTMEAAVPQTLFVTAQTVVKRLSCISGFPANFVLDMGLFEKDGIRFADVVEINPISTSMCYSGNSIFNIADNSPVPKPDGMPFGVEFERDRILYPQKYANPGNYDMTYHRVDRINLE